MNMMGENMIFAQIVSEVNSAVHYSVLADETISQNKSGIELHTIQFIDCLPHMYVTRSQLYPCRALHLYSTTDAAQFEAVDKRKSWQVGIKNKVAIRLCLSLRVSE